MKFKSIFLALALALAGLFVFAGCAAKKLTDEHIEIGGDVPDWLAFNYVNHVARTDGLLEFEARFKNKTNKDQILSYKVIWFNENGMTEKNILSRGVSTVVEAGRYLTIHGVAPSVSVKDFRVEIGDQSDGDKKRLDSYHNRYSN